MKPMDELARPGRAVQSVADVRRDLEQSRQRLASSAEALRTDLREGISDLRQEAAELKKKLSLKTWVARNPWGFVAGAVMVGIFLGSRSR